MFLTTAGRTDKESIQYAYKLAHQLDIPFVARRKRSIKAIKLRKKAMIVLYMVKIASSYIVFKEKNHFFFIPI